MQTKELVEVQISLEQAEILAQISKRLGYVDFRSIAETTGEAYRMGAAMAVLRQRLAEQGVEVR